MSERSSLASYDDVPYPILSFSQSHPDRLATLSFLLGMEPAPVENCRVLELGCASGGNLIPMAHALPNSAFVGVDLSAQQIAEGQEAIEALQLKNISLKHMDILEIEADLGEFDYIIAHGVYSWVPATVRDKLLAVCQRHLAPQGVAYISYNTYPGWHMMDMVRRMMLYHTRDIDDPLEKAAEARFLMQFLAQETRNADQQGYVSFLNTYVNVRLEKDKGIIQRREAMLLHDELEAVNQPVYFHEFAEHAAQHGLQYLTESEFPKVMTHKFSPEAVERLNQMSGDIIEFEQYLDFLGNRTLRQTLLCHADVSVQRRLQPERMTQLYIASVAQPLEIELDITSKSPAKFGASDGAIFTTDHPLTKAALHHLTKNSPQAYPFEVLVSLACSYLEIESPAEQDVGLLAANLLQAFTYSMQLVELHAYLPAFTVEISEKPIGSSFARFQAKAGARVTNLRHERVDLDGVSHIVLQCLNGQHDLESLVDVLMTLLERGAIRLRDGDSPTREQMIDEVERSLCWLAGVALLVG